VLPAGRAMSWRPRPGARLTVVSGRIWLTESADPLDHFIAAGQTHVVSGRARIVIESDRGGPAVVELRDPPGVARGRAARLAWLRCRLAGWLAWRPALAR